MNDLKIVKNILEKFYDLHSNPTFIFGSRANNTHREDSDLDILIEDTSLESSKISFLNEAFEQSSLRYKVDLVLKSRINEDFYIKIKNNCIKL